jgi:hypothetical protein
MANGKKPYRKLSGNRFGLFFTQSLWQGDDHLLRVESGMMTERYWRFYFADIQAVLLTRTRTHYFWSLVWTILVLLWGASLLIETFPRSLAMGFGFFFLLLLAVNLILGPSCRVQLQTAVQVQRLPGLKRVRKARRVMDRIREAAERVQGPLSPSAFRPASNRPADSPAFDRLAFHQVPGSRAVDADTAKGLTTFSPRLHQMLFGTLLVGALCHGGHLFAPHPALVVVTHGLLLVLIVVTIVALVRNFEGMRGSPLAKITWTSLVLIAAQGVAVYIMYMFMIVSLHNPQAAYNNWAILSAYIEFQLNGMPFCVGVTAACAVIDLLLGGIGFAILLTHKQPGSE